MVCLERGPASAGPLLFAPGIYHGTDAKVPSLVEVQEDRARAVVRNREMGAVVDCREQ